MRNKRIGYIDVAIRGGSSGAVRRSPLVLARFSGIIDVLAVLARSGHVTFVRKRSDKSGFPFEARDLTDSKNRVYCDIVSFGRFFVGKRAKKRYVESRCGIKS